MILPDLAPTEADREDFAEFMSGSKLLPGAMPAAHCYCGYQFGICLHLLVALYSLLACLFVLFVCFTACNL